MLFATLDTKTARWELGGCTSVLLSDTVGFIRSLPHGLIASFRATLEEAIHADLILHVVDVSAPTAWQQVESVDEVLAELGCQTVPQITLLNKIDVAKDSSVADLLAGRRRESLRISALTGEGVGALVAEVVKRATRNLVEVTLCLPHREGKLAAEIDRRGEVLARRYGEDGVELDVRIDRAHLQQLRHRYRCLSVVGGDPLADDDARADEQA
jgi:GTP-binding protein HflX